MSSWWWFTNHSTSRKPTQNASVRDRKRTVERERESERIRQLIMFGNLCKRACGEVNAFQACEYQDAFSFFYFQNLWLKPIYLISSHPLLTLYLSNCLTVQLSFLHISLSLYLFLYLSQFISLLFFLFTLLLNVSWQVNCFSQKVLWLS